MSAYSDERTPRHAPPARGIAEMRQHLSTQPQHARRSARSMVSSLCNACKSGCSLTCASRRPVQHSRPVWHAPSAGGVVRVLQRHVAACVALLAYAMPPRFSEQYRCYPVSFHDKAELENGDKSASNSRGGRRLPFRCSLSAVCGGSQSSCPPRRWNDSVRACLRGTRARMRLPDRAGCSQPQ